MVVVVALVVAGDRLRFEDVVGLVVVAPQLIIVGPNVSELRSAAGEKSGGVVVGGGVGEVEALGCSEDSTV